VLDQACEWGLTHLAFTNHDTTRGLSTALALDGRHGIRVIGGVEISAFDFERNRKVHILGLGLFSEDAPTIAALCEPVLRRRHENTLWQMEQLEKHGVAFDRAAIYQAAQDATALYRQHIMEQLTDAPYASSAYQRLNRLFFRDGNICERDIEYVDARDAVQAIKEDGGIAVLAHPGRLDNFAFVPALVDAGLDGIEKYHPDHNERDLRVVEQLARDHALIVTGGSDYHGRYGAPAHVGLCMIDRLDLS
jgi:predicted metal-dependent phosphoesterase TrpH